MSLLDAFSSTSTSATSVTDKSNIGSAAYGDVEGHNIQGIRSSGDVMIEVTDQEAIDKAFKFATFSADTMGQSYFDMISASTEASERQGQQLEAAYSESKGSGDLVTTLTILSIAGVVGVFVYRKFN